MRLISCDTFCHVVLKVLVEDGVVVLMITLRSGEVYHIIGCGLGNELCLNSNDGCHQE